MELLNELFALLEKDTPGLKLGAFKLDTKKGVIVTKIGEKTYEFTPNSKNPAELFNSVTGVAKHSPGRALVYLKQHAKGTPVTESLVVEDAKDLVRYDEMSKFEDALATVAKKKKSKGFDVTMIGGVNVYSIKGQFFAALDRRHEVGIIDPDFKGAGSDLADELKKHLKESIVIEDVADQVVYTDKQKFEDAVTEAGKALKLISVDTATVSGITVYYKRSKYFAAWDPERSKGIIDPDFKDKAPELVDQLANVK
jgi:dihydrofolate reductase